MKYLKGFSLLEILVVLLILGILAAAGFPVYQEQLLRSRRTDARIGLSQAALRQEEWFLHHRGYAGDLNDLRGRDGVLLSPRGHYEIRLNEGLGNCAAEGGVFLCYVLSARPRGRQNRDRGCALLYLDQSGARNSLDEEGREISGCW